MTPGGSDAPMKSGDALKETQKEIEARRKASRAYDKKVEQLRKSWIVGTEMTPAELARVQPNLKAEFYARQQRRSA